MRPSALMVYVNDLPSGEKDCAPASHLVSVTHDRRCVATSSSATLLKPFFAFDVMSSVLPSGESDVARLIDFPSCGVRFCVLPVATSMLYTSESVWPTW